MKILMVAMAALILAGCLGRESAYKPEFALEVQGDITAPLTVEFHTASGFAITRPADEAATGEGDVNLGLSSPLRGGQAVDLIQSNLPDNL